jgi:solute carrier family 25 phosphate transporter 3
MEGFAKIYRAEGLRGNFTGWGPTLVGYSFQGARLWLTGIDNRCRKIRVLRTFKKKYADIVGEETAHKYRTTLYLTASASAEFIADVLLCPWEAIKFVCRLLSHPSLMEHSRDGIKITTTEGIAGYTPTKISTLTIGCIRDYSLFGVDNTLYYDEIRFV